MGSTWRFDGARRAAAASVPRAPTSGRFGLLEACHPVPSSAVTVLASAYGVSIGSPRKQVTLVATTVLAGQPSIGSANDLIDVGRDRATGRHPKSLATGEMPPLGWPSHLRGRGSWGRWPVAAAVTVAAVVILAGLAIVGEGKMPFHAAVGIAVVDVVLLLLVR